MKRTLIFLALFSAGLNIAVAAEEISASAKAQIQALQTERASRSPAEQKMDSQLIYAVKQSRNEDIAPGVNKLRSLAKTDGNGRVEVDITGAVTPALLDFIAASGGQVVNSVSQFQAVRATIPLSGVHALAARADVRFVRAATQPQSDTGSVTSEGDRTHAADSARSVFGVDGSGVKVGVLSDSVDFLAASQASGNAPQNVTILQGQGGAGTGEGTAMLEIIHDLAPGAQLFFATAGGGPANFAQNILALRAAGCDVIVDDVRYPDEPVFQDGVVARAVNAVTASGALYFASAGNAGNKSDGTSGTWEGDFVDAGAVGNPVSGRGGRLHSFGATPFNTCTGPSSQGFIALYWSDPLGGSTNDYDLFVLDAAGNNVVSSSTTVQSGTQDPFEMTQGPATGERVVVVKVSGDPRFLHIDTGRGRLQISTDGFARGHSAATNAMATAAVDAATSFPNTFNGGVQNPVETFSSDGPRRMFFHENGQPITPGNFLASGGSVRPYPAIAAADGVQTSVPGFSPFFGTSAAAPHAAAIAALLKSGNTSLSPAELRHILTNTASDIEIIGVDSDSGAGIVGAYRALRGALPLLSLVNSSIQGGNGNGIFDPNECNELVLQFENRDATNFSAGAVYLYSLTPGITVVQAVRFIPNLPPQSSYTISPPFQILSAPDFNCGVPVRFSLVITNGSTVDTSEIEFQSGLVSLSPAQLNNSFQVGIPDNNANGVDSVINVSGMSGGLGKVTVSAHIGHSLVRDLTLQLIGPDGTTVDLARNRGAFGANYGTNCTPLSARTTFDDNAPDFIALATAPFVGVFRPDQSLSAFAGKAGSGLNGTWRLRITDSAPGNLGTLNCWTLSLFPAVCTDGGGACTADVVVSATASPTPALLGQDLTYTVFVTNTRPISAASVVLTNVLPANVTYVSATSTQGACTFSNGIVLCDFGPLDSASNAVVTIVVQPTAVGSVTNVFSAGSLTLDANPANNTATIISIVSQPAPQLVADGAQLVGDATGGIEAGETVTVNLALRNLGSAATTNLVATLLEGNGISAAGGPQNYGAIAAGTNASRAFTFTAAGNVGDSISAVLQLQDGVQNLGTAAFHFTLGGEVTFVNGAAITINQLGIATPYPSTISVGGVTGVIGKVRVTFTKLSHTYPDDIDALVTGPRGQKLVLMSDAGGSTPVVNKTLTFDGAAGAALANEAAIDVGNFLPSNYDSGTEPFGDIFPAPAPVGPLSSSFLAFNSTDPNGTWSLFVHDDGGNDAGSISGGWALAITVVVPVNPLANLSIAASAAPNPAVVGEPLTYTLTVVNLGPSNAPSVVVSDTIPAGSSFVEAVPSQGSASFAAGVVTVNLGTISNGASATVTVTVTPTSSGFKTNSATVSAISGDLDLSNNTATTVLVANNPVADLTLLVTSAPSPLFVSSNVTFTVIVTNRGPNHADSVRITNLLSSSLGFVSATNTQGSCAFSNGIITCDFGSLPASASATAVIVANALGSGGITNLFAVVSPTTDPIPANNSTNVIGVVNPLAPLIVSAGVALVSESVLPANGAIESGELVTVNFGLRNAGTADAGNLVATLQSTGGVLGPSSPQTYGAMLVHGPTVSRSFSFIANSPAGSTLTATLLLDDGGQNLGTVSFTFTLSASRTFTNSSVIIIPDNGKATNYPSTLTVASTGTVSKVTVTIKQLAHTFPEDIDMLLVSPAGQKIKLMSDAGAGNSITNVTLIFDDSAPGLPFSTAITSGTYHATDFPPGDSFPTPAPAGPYGTNLAVLNSVDPNGTWSLYVFDDANGDQGRVNGGWTLDIQTASPVASSADVAVSATAPATSPPGATFTNVISVANHGPATATGVVLTDTLPNGFTLGSVTVSQGSFSTGAGSVAANLGTLIAGATATITISGSGAVSMTNSISVSAAQSDANLANNSTTLVTLVVAPGLSIRLTGTNVVISWPAPSAGYVLESSASVSGAWVTVSAGITVVNGENQVTIPATGTAFYRLRKP